jgi:hypothetical protein
VFNGIKTIYAYWLWSGDSILRRAFATIRARGTLDLPMVGLTSEMAEKFGSSTEYPSGRNRIAFHQGENGGPPGSHIQE